MDWNLFLREEVLSAPLMAAFLVLFGVIITAIVTTHIAHRNRISAETTASDRLEAEQKQKALDRAFPDRAKTYLAARAWLKKFGDIARGSIVDPVWEHGEWSEPVSEAAQEEIRNKIEVYGTSNAAELFEATAGAFRESCVRKSHAHGLRGMRRSNEEEHGTDAPFFVRLDQDLYLQQADAEGDGEGYRLYGEQLLAQFTELIQEDLADADTAKKELVIPRIDNEHHKALTRQRRRKFEGTPLPEGEEEIEDWGN